MSAPVIFGQSLQLTAELAAGAAALAYLIRLGRKVGLRLEVLARLVEQELKPNGGSSLRDHVTRNTLRIEAIETALGEIRRNTERNADRRRRR